MVQVLEMIWMLNELIQANLKVFMNFLYIDHYGACFEHYGACFEHYSACFGDDIDAKMTYF